MQERVRALKRDTLALCLAARHPRTPWYATALAAFFASYLLSPIDLIPDFVPVLGYLDDLVSSLWGSPRCYDLYPQTSWMNAGSALLRLLLPEGP